MKEDNFKKLVKLADRYLEEDAWYEDRGKMLKIQVDHIVIETQEMRDEIKKDNKVYLEDELCDVLLSYLMVVKLLKEKGYSSDIEDILKKTLIKYEERIEGDVKNMDYDERALDWAKTKEKQKNRLKEEHKKIYKK